MREALCVAQFLCESKAQESKDDRYGLICMACLSMVMIEYKDIVLGVYNIYVIECR